MEVAIGNVLGGVNYSTPPAGLPSYFLADAQNIVPTLSGYATKRGGSSKMNTTAYGTIITSLHELVIAGTSNRFAVQGTKIGKYNSGTGAFVDHNTIALTTGLYGQWLNYGDYAIYVNGTDTARKTDGTTESDLTSDLSGLPGARCIAEWGERIWVGGYTGNIATLVGSALRAPTDFNTATAAIGYWTGTIGNKNQGITGLFPFYDILLIGKQNQLYLLAGAPETDSSTFSLKPLQTKDKDSIGFTSKNAITQVGNDLIFLDGFDIKRLSGINQYGDVESVSVLGNVKDFFRSSTGAALSSAYLQNASFFHYKFKEQVWCSLPTGANTRFWFILDYSNRSARESMGLQGYSFFPMAGLTPIYLGGFENGTRVDPYAGCEDGFIRQLDTGTNDTSTAIDAHATWSIGAPDRNVQAGYVNLSIKYASACSMTLGYAYGLNDWADIRTAGNFTNLDAQDLSDETWTNTGVVGKKRFSDMAYQSGRSFAFKIRHNTASQTFEIRGSTIMYRKHERWFM
jgi:hypothetical protein